MTKDLDKKIRILRQRTRSAVEVEEIYFYFELLDKAQRERFAKCGSFLPASNGKVFVYGQTDDIWLSY